MPLIYEYIVVCVCVILELFLCSVESLPVMSVLHKQNSKVESSKKPLDIVLDLVTLTVVCADSRERCDHQGIVTINIPQSEGTRRGSQD